MMRRYFLRFGILGLFAIHGVALDATLLRELELDYWVYAVAFTPDDRCLITCERLATEGGEVGGFLKVWEVSSGVLIKTIEQEEGGNISMALSPDGKLIAASSDDGIIKIWDSSSAKVIHSFKGNRFALRSLDFSSDGTLLASASDDNTVRIWDLSQGSLKYVLSTTKESVDSVRFAPKGTIVYGITEGSSSKVKGWELSTAKELFAFGNDVSSMDISPDGSRIATANRDGMVQLWDAETGNEHKLLGRHENGGRNILIQSLCFSKDGSYISIGDSEGIIKIWDLETGCVVCTLQAHKSDVTTLQFSLNGKLLASGSIDRTVKIWSLSSSN
ncbi:MAG: WD40 repeat domain-containing protein [Spirochaetes bacterium]|nr:WD40 repeat domain-containing protein [Spirochaetota bacterium]